MTGSRKCGIDFALRMRGGGR